MDEIGRGTSTFDGLALAGAIARHLHEQNRAFTLFATHYFELTEFPAKHQRALNVHVERRRARRRHRLPARDRGRARRAAATASRWRALAGMPAARGQPRARRRWRRWRPQQTATPRAGRPVRAAAARPRRRAPSAVEAALGGDRPRCARARAKRSTRSYQLKKLTSLMASGKTT